MNEPCVIMSLGLAWLACRQTDCTHFNGRSFKYTLNWQVSDSNSLLYQTPGKKKKAEQATHQIWAG